MAQKRFWLDRLLGKKAEQPAPAGALSGAKSQVQPATQMPAQPGGMSVSPGSEYWFGPRELAARHATEAQAPLEWKDGDLILDTYQVDAILGEGGWGRSTKSTIAAGRLTWR